MWAMSRVLVAGSLLLLLPVTSLADSPGRLKVLGASLLVPGWGHAMLGQNKRATAFMAVDGAIWVGFGAFRLQGEIRKDRYIEIAELFAGVAEADGRSDEYYRRIGDFRSAEIYDDEVRRDARARHGDDLQARDDYFRRYRVPDDQAWEWRSTADWRRYRDKRSDSLRSFKRSQYLIGVAVANRLVAAVDAMRSVHRRDREESLGLFMDADPLDPSSVRIGVRLPVR